MTGRIAPNRMTSVRSRVGDPSRPSQSANLTTPPYPDEMVGLLCVAMPIGHAVRTQFDPIYLRRRNQAAVPVGSKYFCHPPASCEDVPKFYDPDPVDICRLGPGASRHHGLLVSFSGRSRHISKAGDIVWRRGSESNRRIKVLQTFALPLGYRAQLEVYSKNTAPWSPKSNGQKAFDIAAAVPYHLPIL
jgi:hypothetical protein